MWTLTYTVNEYNQQGEYLICVFESKPSVSDLRSLPIGHLGLISTEAQTLFRAGSCLGPYLSYYLREVTPGEINPSVIENWSKEE